MAAFLKPTLLKLELKIVITKLLPFGTSCFLVPFLYSFALVLTLKWLEISLSLVYGSHFSTLLQASSTNSETSRSLIISMNAKHSQVARSHKWTPHSCLSLNWSIWCCTRKNSYSKIEIRSEAHPNVFEIYVT